MTIGKRSLINTNLLLQCQCLILTAIIHVYRDIDKLTTVAFLRGHGA